MNEKDFDTNKLVHQKEHKLKGKINLPYIFQITTNQKTKISVSHNDKNGNKKIDCNTVAPKDSLLKFENNNKIYFDLLSIKHISSISINNEPIVKYLNKIDGLVRGTFEPKNKILSLEFYSY